MIGHNISSAQSELKKTLASHRVPPAVKDHAGDIIQVQTRLLDSLNKDLPQWLGDNPLPAQKAALDLIDAGGKRLRPLIALLSASAAGGDAQQAMPVAAAVELLHTGTLLHDDVIDEGNMRRGKPAAHTLWGNGVAVLSGDFCFFAALDALVKQGQLPILSRAMVLARDLAAGELIQLQQRGQIDGLDKDTYFKLIEKKTAALFAFASWAGAKSITEDPATLTAMDQMGRHMGIAFQIVDDLLDLEGDAAVVGKNLGHDLLEGTITLPVLLALEEVPSLREKLRSVLALHQSHGQEECGQVLTETMDLVTQTNALKRSQLMARKHTQASLSALAQVPPNEAQKALASILISLEGRTH